MPTRAFAALVVAASLSLTLRPSAQVAHRSLTPAEIESAIADGIRAKPEPYRLRQEVVREDGSVSWYMGFGATVTTPYRRAQSAVSKACVSPRGSWTVV